MRLPQTQPRSVLHCLLQIQYFFFNDSATPEIYTLSLHDALPICDAAVAAGGQVEHLVFPGVGGQRPAMAGRCRSEEHTSELQSRQYLVCRLLLEKKKSVRQRPIELRMNVERKFNKAISGINVKVA